MITCTTASQTPPARSPLPLVTQLYLRYARCMSNLQVTHGNSSVLDEVLRLRFDAEQELSHMADEEM